MGGSTHSFCDSSLQRNLKRTIYCYQNGSVYVGSIIGNKPHGEGTLYKADGDIYCGTWVKGVLSESGLSKQQRDGVVMVGEKTNGLFSADIKAYFRDGQQQTVKLKKDKNKQNTKYEICQRAQKVNNERAQKQKNQRKGEKESQINPSKQLKKSNIIYEFKGLAQKGELSSVFKYETDSTTYENLKVPFHVKYLKNNLSNFYLTNQYQIMIKLQSNYHKNVLQISQILRQNDQSYFLLQACQGTLADAITRMDNKLYVLFHMLELAKGLEHLHKYGCYQNNIRPQNIFITFKKKQIEELITLKYSDFVRSKILRQDSDQEKQKAFTFKYTAPQKIGFEIKKLDQVKMDIWSLGIIYIEMLAGSFMGENFIGDIRTFSKWDQKKVKELISSKIRADFQSEKLISIICHMLQSNPEKRPTAKRVKQLIMTLPQFTVQGSLRSKLPSSKNQICETIYGDYTYDAINSSLQKIDRQTTNLTVVQFSQSNLINIKKQQKFKLAYIREQSSLTQRRLKGKIIWIQSTTENNIVKNFGILVGEFHNLRSFRLQSTEYLGKWTEFDTLANCLNCLQSLEQVSVVTTKITYPNWTQKLDPRIRCTIEVPVRVPDRLPFLDL